MCSDEQALLLPKPSAYPSLHTDDRTMFLSSLPYILGFLLISQANTPAIAIAGRAVTGLGVGLVRRLRQWLASQMTAHLRRSCILPHSHLDFILSGPYPAAASRRW